MKITISNRQLFALGFILLLLTNVFVLVGVVYNRSGEPDAHLTLTERELKSPYYTRKEDSSLTLRIVWRALSDQMSDRYLYYSRPMMYSGFGSTAEWLDRNKLDTLGFDTERVLRDGGDRKRRKVSIPREAYIVLEYDGAAYQQALARAGAAVSKERESLIANPQDEKLQERLKKAKLWLTLEQIEESRLFAIDAGLDTTLLRQRYSDNGRYIIAKGLITAEYRGSDCAKPNVYGRIKSIDIDSILVPLQFRHFFTAATDPRTVHSDDPPIPPRYAVDLAYGSRLEPWIEGVHKLQLEEQVSKPAK